MPESSSGRVESERLRTEEFEWDEGKCLGSGKLAEFIDVNGTFYVYKHRKGIHSTLDAMLEFGVILFNLDKRSENFFQEILS